MYVEPLGFGPPPSSFGNEPATLGSIRTRRFTQTQRFARCRPSHFTPPRSVTRMRLPSSRQTLLRFLSLSTLSVRETTNTEGFQPPATFDTCRFSQPLRVLTSPKSHRAPLRAPLRDCALALRLGLRTLLSLFHPSCILRVAPFRGFPDLEPDTSQLALPLFPSAYPGRLVVVRALRRNSTSSEPSIESGLAASLCTSSSPPEEPSALLPSGSRGRSSDPALTPASRRCVTTAATRTTFRHRSAFPPLRLGCACAACRTGRPGDRCCFRSGATRRRARSA